MNRDRRLILGVTGLCLLVFLCMIGPLLLPDPPAADPAHAALLPPGTAVSEIVLDDGRILVSPRIRNEQAALIVEGPRRTIEVARELDRGLIVTVLPDGGFKYLSERFWKE